jgi:inosine-uridine nucleoside N-ribohydrolase
VTLVRVGTRIRSLLRLAKMTQSQWTAWTLVIPVVFALTGSAKSESQPAAAAAKRPIPLVFDTDIGNDIDDALALGMIHALECRGECELKAVTITKDHPLSAALVDVINTFYGRGDVPIGVVHGGPTPEPSGYTVLADQKDGDQLRYPHHLTSGTQAPDAVAVLRKVLADSSDGSVVVVQVGASTNLSRLLSSGKDEYSSMSGLELVQKKVRLLSVMAGSFVAKDGKQQGEYNVKLDLPSAKALVSRWPTPIVFSGFEIGLAVTFPAVSIERDFAYVNHHPLAEAYKLYDRMPYDRPTWDLTSVLYAVRPDRGYFDLSPPGRVRIEGDGVTVLEPDPAGQHRFLILRPDKQLRVQEALVQLASQPPCAAANK